jgi:hypothetical protein
MDSFLTESKSSPYIKDNNNNLSEKQCFDFIELYNNASGNLTNIINPKTKKNMYDLNRIRFIYEKCLTKVGFTDNRIVNCSTVYEKMLSNITLDDLFNIIEDPLFNSNFISIITTKIFGPKITF